MSRLDDELRIALRREEPSPDFVSRVMSALPAPRDEKQPWWQQLVDMLRMPRARFVAAGAAAALVIAIGALQYSRLQAPALEAEAPQQAARTQAPSTDSQAKESAAQDRLAASGAGEKKESPRLDKPSRVSGPRKLRAATPAAELASSREPKAAAPKAPSTKGAAKSAGEIAKDKLMMALRIASETLNETQKLIQGED